jgi:hypothetical protein
MSAAWQGPWQWRRLALAATLLACAAAPAAEPATALPDWSGWWTTAPPVSEEWQQKPPPLNARAQATWDLRLKPDANPDPLRYCRPLSFTGYAGGFEGALEFLFTPGRVTLTSEDGRLRRVYTDGRAVPADMEASNGGVSVGHWEGTTLVVVTTHLNPEAYYPNSTLGAPAIGRNARIVERISLKDADTLVFDIETTAPDVLTGPDRRTRLYKRTPKAMAQEITFCADRDRSVDPAGRQRFDMTPPRDLPPPPR